MSKERSKRETLIAWGLFLSCALYIASVINWGRGLTHSPVLTRWVQPQDQLPVFLYFQLPLLIVFLIFLFLKLALCVRSGCLRSVRDEGADLSPLVPLIFFLVLGVIAFLIWRIILTRGYFFWDDHEHIPHVRYLSNPLVMWLHGHTPGQDLRPMAWLLYWIDFRLWGARSASGYYATNMTLHFVNALMVYIMGRSFLGKRDIPLLASGMYFFLPIAARTYLFLPGRDILLEMLLCFFSLWCYTIYVSRQRVALYVLSLFAFSLSLMSREQVVAFPFIIILSDLFWGKRRKLRKRIFEYSFYFYIVAAFMIYRTLVMGGLGHVGDNIGALAIFLLDPFLRMPRAFFIFDEVVSGPQPFVPLWRTLLMTGGVISLMALSFRKTFYGVNRLAFFSLIWMILYNGPVALLYPWSSNIYPQAVGFCFLMASLLDRGRGRALIALQCCIFALLMGLFALRSYELALDPEQDYDLVHGPQYRQYINAITDFVGSNYPNPEEGTVFILVLEDPKMWLYVNDRYIKSVIGKEYYKCLFIPAALPEQQDFFRGRQCLQHIMLPLELRRYVWMNRSHGRDGNVGNREEGRVDDYYSFDSAAGGGGKLGNIPLECFKYPPQSFGGVQCVFLRAAVELLKTLMSHDWNKKVLYMGADSSIEIKYDLSRGIDHLPRSWIGS